MEDRHLIKILSAIVERQNILKQQGDLVMDALANLTAAVNAAVVTLASLREEAAKPKGIDPAAVQAQADVLNAAVAPPAPPAPPVA